MLRATGLVNVPEEAPLIALVKDLAKELDEGGGARTRTAYLSALKDLRRVLNASAARPRGSAEASSVAAAVAAAESPESDAPEDLPQPNDLARFKASRKLA